MKTKLYRVLVQLVAIAMMIPSFAFAEDATPVTEGKLEITSTEKEIKDTFLSGDASKPISDEKNKIKFAYAVPTNAVGELTLKWNSSNPAVASVDESSTTVTAGESKTEQTLAVYKRGVGTAKITGRLSYDGQVQKTAEFTVTLEAVDVEDIKFAENLNTRYMVSDTAVPFKDAVTVTPKEGGSTYTNDDLAWKIVSGGEFAEVNNSGEVLFEKAGEVTLRAYIPGSEKKAEVKLTVLEKGESTPVEQDKNGYTFLDFNTPEEGNIFYADINGKLELHNFLTKRPANTIDTLDWTVDDGSIAKVTSAGFVTINKAGRGKKVKVTVTSRTTGKSDWCYVIWENEKDTSKPYTKLAFNTTDVVTLRVEPYPFDPDSYQSITISNYLSVKEPSDADDSLVWECSDYSVATIYGWDSYAYVTPKKLDTEVTITARSKADGKVVTNPGLKVKFVKEATKIPYTKIEFDGEKKLTVKKGMQNVYFWLKEDYMTLEPSTANEGLYFYSDNEDVAKVDIDGELTVCAQKDGKATITVTNEKGDKTDTLTVEATVVTDPYTTLAFKDFLKHKMTVKMTEFTKTVPLWNNEYLTTEGGADDELIWTSSDKTVAKVTNSGLVTLVGEGTAKITVRNYDGTKTDYIDLTVEEVKNPYTKLAFIPAEPLTKKLSEESVNLEKKFLYTETKKAGESDDELNWIVDDRTVATVKDGVVTFKSAGTVKVTVFNADKSASAEITITIVKDEKVIKTITPAAESIKVVVGDNIDLNDYVTIDPAEYEDELVWTSSNQQIVKFPNYIEGLGSVDGVAKPIAKGEVTVTVYSKLNPENKKSFKLDRKSVV